MSSKQFLYDIDHDEDDEGAHLDEEYGSALTGHNFASTGFKVTKKRNAKAAKRQQSAQARAQSQKQQVRAAFLAVCQLEADAMLPYFKYSRDVLVERLSKHSAVVLNLGGTDGRISVRLPNQRYPDKAVPVEVRSLDHNDSVAATVDSLVQSHGDKPLLARDVLVVLHELLNSEQQELWRQQSEQSVDNSSGAAVEQEEHTPPADAAPASVAVPDFFDADVHEGELTLPTAVGTVVTALLDGKTKKLKRWATTQQSSRPASNRRPQKYVENGDTPQGFDPRFNEMLMHLLNRARHPVFDHFVEFERVGGTSASSVANRVCDGLYIGPLNASRDWAALQKNKIGAIVSLGGYYPQFSEQLQYCQVNVRDRANENMFETFDVCNAFIVDYLATAAPGKANVLVHCFGGRSRSASICAAFLIAHRGATLVRLTRSAASSSSPHTV